MSAELQEKANDIAEGGGRDRAWWLSSFLAVVGLAAASYLTWLKFSGAYEACIGVGDCELVNQSRFSELGGVPIALLGAGMYLTLLGLLIWERMKRSEWPLMVLFGLTTFGTLYSAYLTYIELAVLHAVCPYCLVSAIAMTLLWVVTLFRLQSAGFFEA